MGETAIEVASFFDTTVEALHALAKSVDWRYINLAQYLSERRDEILKCDEPDELKIARLKVLAIEIQLKMNETAREMIAESMMPSD